MRDEEKEGELHFFLGGGGVGGGGSPSLPPPPAETCAYLASSVVNFLQVVQ